MALRKKPLGKGGRKEPLQLQLLDSLTRRELGKKQPTSAAADAGGDPVRFRAPENRYARACQSRFSTRAVRLCGLSEPAAHLPHDSTALSPVPHSQLGLGEEQKNSPHRKKATKPADSNDPQEM